MSQSLAFPHDPSFRRTLFRRSRASTKSRDRGANRLAEVAMLVENFEWYSKLIYDVSKLFELLYSESCDPLTFCTKRLYCSRTKVPIDDQGPHEPTPPPPSSVW
eukprot:1642676-Rhodomonas_salina.1